VALCHLVLRIIDPKPFKCAEWGKAHEAFALKIYQKDKGNTGLFTLS